MLTRFQKIRDDTGDEATVVQRGLGDRAHQANRSAAIDEANLVLGERLSQGDGSFDKAGIGTGAGAAIDTDSFDLIHHHHVAPHPLKLKPDFPSLMQQKSARNPIKRGKDLSFKAVRER